ncbi:MAG: hypothetical protein DME26_10445, partial [Verrucomicrobia bacterium]
MHTLTGMAGPIQHNWREIWLTPALGATAVLIIFMIFFREPPRKTPAEIIAGRKEEALEMP